MNAKTFFAAAAAFAALAAAAPAFAGEATPDYPVAFTSSTSRADVYRATLQARAAGQIASGEASTVAETTGTPLTRAQVVAETLEAVRIGAINRSEQSTFPTAQQLESIRQAGLKALPMTMAGL